MKRSFDANTNWQLISHSRPVIITFVVAIVSLLSLLTIKIVGRVQQVQFERQLEIENQFRAPEPELVLTKEDLKYGKYYLNGDRNSYYFQINEDDTIVLVSDDLYSIFDKWNPNTPETKKMYCEEFGSPRKFTTEELSNGYLLLQTELIWNEERNEYIGAEGIALADYDRLKWGIEGDFIYLEDAQEDASEVDQSETDQSEAE